MTGNGVAAEGTMNAPDKIAEDLRERYDKCCHPDDEAYSAWECTLIERVSASEERERVLREALEVAENKARAHDGLVALKNGIPETTGDPVFDEVLRLYPVAAMIQRGWLVGVIGFDDLPLLKKSLLRFFEADELEQIVDLEFQWRRLRTHTATPAPQPTTQPKGA